MIDPASSGDAISVLIADDHALVRHGLVSVIQTEAGFTIAGEAEDGQRALEIWRERQPTVTLMDLKMPRMDGVSAIQAIRAEDPKALIVILTTYDGEADIFRGMSAGAKGYLLKDVDDLELLGCLRTVAGGGMYVPGPIAIKLAHHLSAEALTTREVEVLALVAEGAPNRTIAERLFISEGTVKTHLKRIVAKLDATSRTEAVAIAARRGLIRQ